MTHAETTDYANHARRAVLTPAERRQAIQNLDRRIAELHDALRLVTGYREGHALALQDAGEPLSREEMSG